MEAFGFIRQAPGTPDDALVVGPAAQC